jgi:hypothetical protein
MHLAVDWHLGTGSMPEPGRGDKTGFGQMVHLLFGWLDEPGAERALRDYWRKIKERQQTEKS